MANYVSWCKCCKRRYGDKHWFWAVWVDIDRDAKECQPAWAGQSPSAHGFCESEHEAKRSAGVALSSLGHNAYCRGYGWALHYLGKLESQQRDEDRRKLFYRYRSGKRWFWIVSEDFFGWETPLATGFAESKEDALSAAEAIVGAVRDCGPSHASTYLKKQACLRRMTHVCNQNKAATIECREYVYQHFYSDYDDSSGFTRYRIIKKTKTRVYVAINEPSGSSEWWDYDVRTFVLDRQKLESEGACLNRRHGLFWVSPEAYRAANQWCPECFAKLGLKSDATEQEIKRAFRSLAKRTHPDAGGDPEEFKDVVGWYEEALQRVAQKASTLTTCA